MEDELVKFKNALYYQQKILKHYGEGITFEHGMPIEFVADIYGETGLLFPETVTKHLEAVEKFHKQIIINRKDYLAPEMEKISQNIIKLVLQIAVLEKENDNAR